MVNSTQQLCSFGSKLDNGLGREDGGEQRERKTALGEARERTKGSRNVSQRAQSISAHERSSYRGRGMQGRIGPLCVTLQFESLGTAWELWLLKRRVTANGGGRARSYGNAKLGKVEKRHTDLGRTRE